MDYADMPTVDDLREVLRRTYATRRAGGRFDSDDVLFAQRELRALDAMHVYWEEVRRHELIKRGYTPPEDLSEPPSSQSAA